MSTDLGLMALNARDLKSLSPYEQRWFFELKRDMASEEIRLDQCKLWNWALLSLFVISIIVLVIFVSVDIYTVVFAKYMTLQIMFSHGISSFGAVGIIIYIIRKSYKQWIIPQISIVSDAIDKNLQAELPFDSVVIPFNGR